MRIGFDFDNTIVSYDELFHKVALEQGVIQASCPVSKLAVRDYLRSVDREPVWTQMQGYVYGARMAEAKAYPGVLDFIAQAKQAGHSLAIMSHKTKQSFLEPIYDLHSAARDWIELYLNDANGALIPAVQVFFEPTKELKLQRIAEFACDIFIDDLPEILLASAFPSKTQGYLFDPQNHHALVVKKSLPAFSAWKDFERVLGL